MPYGGIMLFKINLNKISFAGEGKYNVTADNSQQSNNFALQRCFRNTSIAEIYLSSDLVKSQNSSFKIEMNSLTIIIVVITTIFGVFRTSDARKLSFCININASNNFGIFCTYCTYYNIVNNLVLMGFSYNKIIFYTSLLQNIYLTSELAIILKYKKFI